MKLMLTSFGAGLSPDANEPLPSEYPLHDQYSHWYPSAAAHWKRSKRTRGYLGYDNPFYAMPPVSMKAMAGPYFLPDYSTLLFADKIVLDTASFSSLQWQHHRSYALVADAMQALKAEGFVELSDYAAILNDNRRVLDQMLESDMESIERWESTLQESAEIWTAFWRRARDLFLTDSSEDEREATMPQSNYLHETGPLLQELNWYLNRQRDRPREEQNDAYSDWLRQMVVPNLAYVNANIVLSTELGVGFHDWRDYSPFYRKKFISVGKLDVEDRDRKAEAVQDLFSVAFPELAIRDVKHFLKLVKDKRVDHLRAKIDEALTKNIMFDAEFARQTLQQVLRVEKQAAYYRHLSFFLTIPLHFVPLIGAAVHKVAEEAVNSAIERKLRKPHQWFYVLSDVSEKHDAH